MPESPKLSIIQACNSTCYSCGKPYDGIAFGDRFIKTICPECQEEKEQAERDRLLKIQSDMKASRIKNIESWMDMGGVNKRYLKCSLDNFDGDYPEIPPCFITGPVGTGKTHLAVGYLKEYIIENGETAGRFIRAVDLFKRILDCFGDHSEHTEMELMELYGGTSLLVLDDLGTEKVSEFVEQTLYDLIDQRYADEQQTIITSNLSISQIAAHYKNHGERLASRICGMGEVYEIKAKDHRLQRRP
jgi:DNA replication protein DnaC